LDGVYAGITPTAQVRVDGKHRVTMTKAGYVAWVGEVEVFPGDPKSVHGDLKPAPFDPTKPKISGLE
jgi:hypothetical protein